MIRLLTASRFLLLLVSASWISTPLVSSAETINEKAKTCMACHGNNGISTNPEYPHLAGQKSGYLTLQMKEFRDGQRNSSIMAATVKNMTDDEIADLADYFANLSPVKTTKTKLNAAGHNVRARCISCHGMKGMTVNPEWPNLAGQHSRYLEKQLMDFKSGNRPSPIMQVIAKELSDQEIKDVAEYYSQL